MYDQHPNARPSAAAATPTDTESRKALPISARSEPAAVPTEPEATIEASAVICRLIKHR